MASVKIFQSYLKTPFLILLSVEVSVLFVSVYAASYLRFYSETGQFGEIIDDLWMPAAIIAVVTPLSMLATGLYQGQIREGMAGVILRLIISFIAAGVIVALIFFLLPDLVLGRGIVAIAIMLSFFVVGTLRAVFIESVDSNVFKKRVLVYGAGNTASHIDLKLRRKSDRRGFEIIGYVLLEGQTQVVDDSRLVPVEGSLLEYSRREKIDEIVVATTDVGSEIPVDDLVNCKLNGIMVVDILTFFEREAGQVRIDILDPSWLVTSDGFRQSRIRAALKRTFDISISMIVLTLAMPFMLLTTLAIWIEDGFRAPIFYSQTRVGINGREFSVHKFRSMRVDAESAGKAVWAKKVDDRVTRVGAFIRKTRLDEFPQLLNVLLGTMSFVGPRPERPQFVNELKQEIPFYEERHLVKPGITGWAQLLYPYGSSVMDAYQKQLFDMYYVKNRSIFLDFLIILQTVEVVLFGKGAR